ncbi:MAG: hypothetical protein KJP09_06405 [Bacteroidia bacterium]|nr:hypothetical protein [Bacteroidia bacterium]MBT8310709.1 hypothetical protein [Bacteroidia bacterium]NND11051.1 hypothetical protein [Flavobacteriaceae bacterium]NNK27381.1 hypothetical protein [Flavobacteriaceae bacterium]NNL61399.1 hypothetical protein [Flavobacteriaceae bacterium]
MKKNLLFALSVFALTVSGLLVFCETSDNKNEDTIENHQSIQVEDEEAIAELR